MDQAGIPRRGVACRKEWQCVFLEVRTTCSPETAPKDTESRFCVFRERNARGRVVKKNEMQRRGTIEAKMSKCKMQNQYEKRNENEQRDLSKIILKEMQA